MEFQTSVEPAVETGAATCATKTLPLVASSFTKQPNVVASVMHGPIEQIISAFLHHEQ